jgi:UV DNA damage repair endonuclease
MHIKTVTSTNGIPIKEVTPVSEVRITQHPPHEVAAESTYDELVQKTVTELIAHASEYYGLTIPYNWRKSRIVNAILNEQTRFI